MVESTGWALAGATTPSPSSTRRGVSFLFKIHWLVLIPLLGKEGVGVGWNE
jgi:hypothetical protein